MISISLDGKWTVRDAAKGSKSFPAVVPGCIHHDLEKAGLIPDPYSGENELQLQWIGEHTWIYERSFNVPAGFLKHDHVILQCEGLDTLAEVSVNGRSVGKSDNMFRQWEFDCRQHLIPGINRISIRFESARLHTRSLNLRKPLYTIQCCPHEEQGRSHIRKEQCNFGWDWGPVLVTAGIWLPIRLCAWNTARISEVRLTQEHSTGLVRLSAALKTEGRPSACTAQVRLQLNDRLIEQQEIPVKSTSAQFLITIRNPELWWPAGQGSQPLYTVSISLFDKSGSTLDKWQRRIGLRSLELVRKRDKWGESFTFACNGRSFFSKGANWIPADAVKGRLKKETVRDLLQSAADSNMNMIRVWGGGLYEYDYFYDMCDELGLCVWQDFMFACSAYPADDGKWMANVEKEAAYQIKRLRHHACLALWCGNNELEGWITNRNKKKAEWPRMPWKNYTDLFDKLLPALVKEHDGVCQYWPASPHTPYGNRDDIRDQSCGDNHLWSVWHGQEPFEWYRSTFSRFCSEFGFQSFPEPRTVAAYAKTDDDKNITSPVMEHHQRSGIGNTTIMRYMLSWFPMPKGSDSVLWLSQIQQGLAIKYAVEHWRQNMERCRGALYWQLNDCWPVASWASIDYFSRWKALQYMSKRFFAPLLVTGVENTDAGTVDIHVSSDLTTTADCTVKWLLTDTDGSKLATGSKRIKAAPDSSSLIHKLNCSREIRKAGQRNILIWLELYHKGRLTSHNMISFVKPKHMNIPFVSYKTAVRKTGPASFSVKVKCSRPSLWTWFALAKTDSRWSDSFACMRPDKTYQLNCTCSRDLSTAEFRKQLEIKSIRTCF